MMESVNGHRGNRQRRSMIEFNVRWAGFLVSHAIVGSLLHVDKLHDYLRVNAIKTLIPSEHKQMVQRIFFKIFHGIFPKSARRRIFPQLVFSGWNPTYLRTLLPHPCYYLYITLSIQHAYIVLSRMVDHSPKEGVLRLISTYWYYCLSVSVKYVLSTYLC